MPPVAPQMDRPPRGEEFKFGAGSPKFYHKSWQKDAPGRAVVHGLGHAPTDGTVCFLFFDWLIGCGEFKKPVPKWNPEVKTWTKTCGLPFLVDFEPNPIAGI